MSGFPFAANYLLRTNSSNSLSDKSTQSQKAGTSRGKAAQGKHVRPPNASSKWKDKARDFIVIPAYPSPSHDTSVDSNTSSRKNAYLVCVMRSGMYAFSGFANLCLLKGMMAIQGYTLAVGEMKSKVCFPAWCPAANVAIMGEGGAAASRSQNQSTCNHHKKKNDKGNDKESGDWVDDVPSRHIYTPSPNPSVSISDSATVNKKNDQYADTVDYPPSGYIGTRINQLILAHNKHKLFPPEYIHAIFSHSIQHTDNANDDRDGNHEHEQVDDKSNAEHTLKDEHYLSSHWHPGQALAVFYIESLDVDQEEWLLQAEQTELYASKYTEMQKQRGLDGGADDHATTAGSTSEWELYLQSTRAHAKSDESRPDGMARCLGVSLPPRMGGKGAVITIASVVSLPAALLGPRDALEGMDHTIYPPSWAIALDKVCSEVGTQQAIHIDSLSNESVIHLNKKKKKEGEDYIELPLPYIYPMTNSNESMQSKDDIKVLLCGAKGVGKSTTLRYSLNRLLSMRCTVRASEGGTANGGVTGKKKHLHNNKEKMKKKSNNNNNNSNLIEQCVAVLDCDVGQPEFTPSGMLSLHLFTPSSCPLYGNNHLGVRTPVRSYFLGETSPKAQPGLMVRMIRELYCAYEEIAKEFKAGRGDDVLRQLRKKDGANDSEGEDAEDEEEVEGTCSKDGDKGSRKRQKRADEVKDNNYIINNPFGALETELRSTNKWDTVHSEKDLQGSDPAMQWFLSHLHASASDDNNAAGHGKRVFPTLPLLINLDGFVRYIGAEIHTAIVGVVRPGYALHLKTDKDATLPCLQPFYDVNDGRITESLGSGSGGRDSKEKSSGEKRRIGKKDIGDDCDRPKMLLLLTPGSNGAPKYSAADMRTLRLVSYLLRNRGQGYISGRVRSLTEGTTTGSNSSSKGGGGGGGGGRGVSIRNGIIVDPHNIVSTALSSLPSTPLPLEGQGAVVCLGGRGLEEVPYSLYPALLNSSVVGLVGSVGHIEQRTEDVKLSFPSSTSNDQELELRMSMRCGQAYPTHSDDNLWLRYNQQQTGDQRYHHDHDALGEPVVAEADPCKELALLQCQGLGVVTALDIPGKRIHLHNPMLSGDTNTENGVGAAVGAIIRGQLTLPQSLLSQGPYLTDMSAGDGNAQGKARNNVKRRIGSVVN